MAPAARGAAFRPAALPRGRRGAHQRGGGAPLPSGGPSPHCRSPSLRGEGARTPPAPRIARFEFPCALS
eukprot:13644106-Alexandrium_andersonii.AAC.1